MLSNGNTAVQENMQTAVFKIFVMCLQAGRFPLRLALNTWTKHFWSVRNVLLADVLLVICYCRKTLYFQKQAGLERKKKYLEEEKNTKYYFQLGIPAENLEISWEILFFCDL